MVDRVFVRLRAIWAAIKLWWTNPATTVEEVEAHRSKTKTSAGHAPIGIELGFSLHADGRVYQRSRWGDGDRRVTSTDVIALVHHEYRAISFRARRFHRRQLIRARLRELLSLRRKDLDTTKDGDV